MLCVQHPSHGPVPSAHSYSTTVDISLLLKKDDEETRTLSSPTTIPRRDSVPSGATTATGSTPVSTGSTVPLKRQLSSQAHPSESPAKKQSKWSPEEDAKIIQLRGDGMKWEDISKHLPGRSAISCRLHYQNYLERRSEWDEDRKNKLARLYERYVEKRCTRSRATNSDR
jgi:Myb-like DNA-binding domain